MTDDVADIGPLSGIRILELGHFIAAPFCTRVLADLGADVIKVEPPGRGDPVRAWGAMPEGDDSSVWWSVHARNKRSITVDLKKPEGIALIKKMIVHADAVVENFKPGQLAKWGLGADDIAAINPEAILVQISGYGQTGPYHKRAAFGVIGEAVGGLRHLTGYPKDQSDLPPVRTGVSIGDSIAGLYGAIGLLAALCERMAGRGKPGRRVDVALTESILSMLEGCLPEYGYMDTIRQPQGSTIPTAAPSSAYPSSDGRWFLIGANSETLYAKLCAVMQRPDLLSDPRYKDNPSRVKNMKALDAEIGAWTCRFTLEELEKMIADVDIPSTRIYDMSDVAADPQFLGRGMVQPVNDPRLGEVLHPGVVPMMVGGSAGGIRWAGPDLGKHNNEVLGDLLGLNETEIARLKQEGVI